MRPPLNLSRHSAVLVSLTPLLAALVLWGCDEERNVPGLTSPTAPPPYTPAANLSGEWAGSYISLADGVDQLTDSTYPATATIEQTGSRVNAFLGTNVPPSPDGVYTFTGSMDGTRLFGTINGFKASGELAGDRLTVWWGYNRWELRR